MSETPTKLSGIIKMMGAEDTDPFVRWASLSIILTLICAKVGLDVEMTLGEVPK